MAKLNTLKGHNVKVGDKVRYHGSNSTGFVREIMEIKDGVYKATHPTIDWQHTHMLENSPNWEVVSRVSDYDWNTTVKVDKPSGGPSAYYDFPFKDWVTVNDMIEYLSEKQWGKHSWIFKDIVKACTRWGSKDGTTYVYDAKKIIYYGARLLMSVADKATLRAYLQELLDDKQFKENNND